MSRDFSVLQVRLVFQSEGLATDGGEWIDDEYDHLNAFVRDGDERAERENAVSAALELISPVHGHLIAIGSVRLHSQDNPTPIYYIVIPGASWRPPECPEQNDRRAPGVNLGFFDMPFPGRPNARLIGNCIAEYVDPDDAFAALSESKPGQGVGCWGGEETPDRLPRPDEQCAEWLQRVAVQSDALNMTFDRLKQVNWRFELFSLFFEPKAVRDTEWLVDAIIPFGAVTLVVGSGAAGKSSAMHELLSVTTAKQGPREFLGRPVADRCPGALLSGEENEGSLKYRQDRHAKVWNGASVLIFGGSQPKDLAAALDQLEQLPSYGLLVVDPATTFLDGDETRTQAVSEFYNPLQAFARRKKWAVVVVHHLVKNPPKSLSHILPSVKGSTVHTDRARMVIAMIDRRNGTVEIGPIKHNFPEGAWLKVEEGQFFRKDPETFRLLPIVAALPSSGAPDGHSLAAVYKAIVRCNVANISVHRTGGSSLYKLRPAEVEGLSRNIIDAAVLSHLDDGSVINTAKGLVAVQSASA